MQNRYLIRGKSKGFGDWQYYSIDTHSGGYPCWLSSPLSAAVLGEDNLRDAIGKIKKDFAREMGVYFSKELEGGTLEYVRVAYIEPIKLSEITEDEIMWPEIEGRLTEEQLEFIKKKMQGVENAG